MLCFSKADAWLVFVWLKECIIKVKSKRIESINSLSFIYLFFTALTNLIPKMYNNNMKKCFNKKGFTLVEIVVVISIIAILGTVVGISANFFIKTAREKNNRTAVQTSFNAVQSLLVEINSGFSTIGSVSKEAFSNVLDDTVQVCEVFSAGEKYTSPTSDKPEGYYIICRYGIRNDTNNKNENVKPSYYLDVLYYVKDGVVWSIKDGDLKKDGVPV